MARITSDCGYIRGGRPLPPHPPAGGFILRRSTGEAGDLAASCLTVCARPFNLIQGPPLSRVQRAHPTRI